MAPMTIARTATDSDMIIRRGEYKIIRVNGDETIYEEIPQMWRICAAIGCSCIDTVILDHKRKQIMMVDDTGMIDGKPVNDKATALYRAICRPGTIHSIHGDVAIVNDADFA
jgi:hypothetical protein